ncbi:MAG: hypothetical protein WAZ19_06855 [Anaerolineae bacterium]
MLNPFLLMAVFYLVIAILAALDATFTSFNLIGNFIGLPWLRVHFITLGVLTETSFGVLPAFVAARRDTTAPAVRWDIWFLLNAGIVLLLAGMTSLNAPLIITGGTLVFSAVLLLIAQLRSLGGKQAPGSGSRQFYLAGLFYLLIGILIGTGYWIGWSETLHIGVPKEAHIHANSWGFASLVFAGLLIDLLPSLTGKPLADHRKLNLIFWAMTLGALGLVLGPWLGGNLVVTAPGLVLHIGATVALLILSARGLHAQKLYTAAGAWHLTLSYAWILLPVMLAPFILLHIGNLPGTDIEATAPQALVYGWMGQFLFALLPYLVARWLLRDRAARLGGNWFSLITVNLGALLIWASILLPALRTPLHAASYVLLGAALLAAIRETVVITLAALRRAEQSLVVPPL